MSGIERKNLRLAMISRLQVVLSENQRSYVIDILHGEVLYCTVTFP